MDWYYATNDQQNGPVSEAQLDELLRAKTIDRDTLVWHSGLAEWQPLHLARTSLPSAAPPVILTGPSAVCVECRQAFPQGDMLFLNKSWVCARCKPIFLQRLAEGAAPPIATGMLWRFNRQMVMRLETPMPDQCVRCNAPANGYRLKRQLYWHPQAYYLLILISILVYAIVALIVRKKAVVHVGLCEAHRAQRKWFIAGSWLAVLVGLGLLIAGIAGVGPSGALAFAGIVLLLGGAIVGGVKATVVSAAKIDDTYVWIKGGSPSFLADLPEWNGPP